MRDPIGEGRKRLGVVLKLEIGAGMLMVCEELDMRPAIRSLEPGQSREVSLLLSLPLGLMAGDTLVSNEEEGLTLTPGVSITTEPEPLQQPAAVRSLQAGRCSAVLAAAVAFRREKLFNSTAASSFGGHMDTSHHTPPYSFQRALQRILKGSRDSSQDLGSGSSEESLLTPISFP